MYGDPIRAPLTESVRKQLPVLGERRAADRDRSVLREGVWVKEHLRLVLKTVQNVEDTK